MKFEVAREFKDYFSTKLFTMTRQACTMPFLFCILLLLASCLENGYYVSQSGDDQNPGTRSKPFKSISKVNSLKLKPGQRIHFKGGETFEGTLSLTFNGSLQDSVFVVSYGDGKATLDGKNKEAMILRGSYFSVRDINAVGTGRKEGNTTNGISIVDASSATVRNVRTEGFQKSGLELYNCRNIVVRKIKAVNNGFSGIHVTAENKTKSKNILIQNCHAENNPGDPTNLDNHSGNGILVGMSDSVVIDHCTATNNGWDMPRIGNGPVGIWAYEASNVTIQYCISYRNKTAKGAKDGGGFDFDGGITNSIIQYCLSYENQGAGYGLFQYAGASPWHNNLVRYCLSVNDATDTEGSGGIFLWNGAEDSAQLADCLIHNNVVYATHAPAVEFEPTSLNKNFFFQNNIFIGTGDIVHGPPSGEVFAGNIWWNADREIQFRGHRNLEMWAAASGQEKINGVLIGKQTNPLLKGPFNTNLTDPYQLHTLLGYTLQAGSPLIDNGQQVNEQFKFPPASTDFFDNRLPQGKSPEPGIHEWKKD